MKIVDIVDGEDNVVGSASKDEVRQKGLLSRVAFVILLNSNNEMCLQQRKSTKKTYPLYWSGSAAGHVQSDESYLAAAVRETKEELGVETKLKEVGKFTSEADKEIVTVFIGRNEGPFRLEEESIEKAEYYSLERLRAEAPTMKLTSYLEAAVQMVEKALSATN